METDKDLRLQLQDFLAKLNREPETYEATPDGKAKSIPISFIEMALDEIFLGQWGTRNFTSKVVLNEVVGELELYVIHPITGRKITRVGSASIIIQVDKAPDNLAGQARNEWALNPSNKKSNALDLGYPKLKAECTKNAAQTLGKVFGRDLNRKKADQLRPQYKELSDVGFDTLIQRVKSGKLNDVALAKSNFLLTEVQVNTLDTLYAEIVKTLSPEPIKQLNGHGSI